MFCDRTVMCLRTCQLSAIVIARLEMRETFQTKIISLIEDKRIVRLYFVLRQAPSWLYEVKR